LLSFAGIIQIASYNYFFQSSNDRVYDLVLGIASGFYLLIIPLYLYVL